MNKISNRIIKSVSELLLGIVVLLGLIFSAVMLIFIGATAAFKIQSVISTLCAILFTIDLAALLGLLIVKARKVLGITIFASSYVFGLSTWIFGLATTLSLWGWPAVIIGIIMGGVGVVPIGLLAAIFTGNWSIFWLLIANVALTYGSRITGVLAISSSERKPTNSALHEYSEIIEYEGNSNRRTWADIE